MVKVKSPRENTRRMVESSIHAFLTEKKNCSLKWVLGVIRTSGISKEDLRDLFSTFPEKYAEDAHFQKLEKAHKRLEKECKRLDFL